MSTNGKTLKVFVMGEHFNSLKSVELVNWTGLGFVGERQHLHAIKNRPELAEPGVYFLLSDNVDNVALTDIYIGETDDFSARILNHAQNKDWWERFIVFVSKDKNLTKAHVKYLEREIVRIAKNSIGNLKVMNSQEPSGASLPESDVSSMKEFLKNIMFVLETLGLSYFAVEEQEPAREIPQDFTIEGQEFYITLPKDLSPGAERLRSFMTIRNGVYILKSGALVRSDIRESLPTHSSYFNLWQQIVSSDAVGPGSIPGVLVTLKDIEFRSPSAAGAVVRARNTNGRTEWRRVSDDLPLHKCEIGSLKDKKAA